MGDVSLNCHRCWRRIPDPAEGGPPPWSWPVHGGGGRPVLMLLCGRCRAAFASDAARAAFLERAARLAPAGARAATDGGVDVLCWDPPSVRVLGLPPQIAA